MSYKSSKFQSPVAASDPFWNLRFGLCLGFGIWSLGFSSSLAVEPTPAQIQFFEARVRPVLAKNCYKCHSHQAEKVKGGLLLDTRDGVLKGGENGAVIVPGDPEKSALIKAIRYTDPDLQMPPSCPIPKSLTWLSG